MRNLREIYERLSRQAQQNNQRINEEELRRRAWMERDRLIFESSTSDGAGAGAGAGGGGGSGNRREVTTTTTSTTTSTTTEAPTTTTTTSTTTSNLFVDAFIFNIDTTVPEFTGPTVSFFIKGNDVSIDWGDGDITTGITSSEEQLLVQKVYQTSGKYTIKMSNGVSLFNAADASDTANSTITGVTQWGTSIWENFYFKDCVNLSSVTSADIPNLSIMTDLQQAFSGCISLTNINRLNEWDMSGITNIYFMFYGATLFNQDISGWNVSKITDMYGAFAGTALDQNLNSWNVSSVITEGVPIDGIFDVTTFQAVNLPLAWRVTINVGLTASVPVYGFSNFNISYLNMTIDDGSEGADLIINNTYYVYPLDIVLSLQLSSSTSPKYPGQIQMSIVRNSVGIYSQTIDDDGISSGGFIELSADPSNTPEMSAAIGDVYDVTIIAALADFQGFESPTESCVKDTSFPVHENANDNYTGLYQFYYNNGTDVFVNTVTLGDCA